jgi:hypothetical protein
VIAEQHRSRIMVSPVLMHPTFLLDGFVAGTWRLDKAKGAVTLTVTPFEPLSSADRQQLTKEGERLARFVEPKAKSIGLEIGG